MWSAVSLRMSTALIVAFASSIDSASLSNWSFVGAFLDGFSSLPASRTILMSPAFSALSILSTDTPSLIRAFLATLYAAWAVDKAFSASCLLFTDSL